MKTNLSVAKANPLAAVEYEDWIRSIKVRIQRARLKALMLANSEQTLLYWDIGHEILVKQEHEGWGTKVVARMSNDLRKSFPDMKGWSRSNLMYMRQFADAWSRKEIVQAPLGQLPWYHHIALSDSDMAEQALKGEYDLGFLSATERTKENKLRSMLVDKVARFLVELGAGFSYVGKALPISVGGDEFELDLLFYHVVLHRYVVIELKTGKFHPKDLGQLGFYMTAIDRQVKAKVDGKTIGILLCKSRNDIVAEYALSDLRRPIGVSTYQLGLPSAEQLQAKLQKLLVDPRDKN